jgi:very-short-patch-repair endonuclease
MICGKFFYGKTQSKGCSKECIGKLISNRSYESNANGLRQMHKRNKEMGIIHPAWNKGMTGDDYCEHYRREGETLNDAKKRFCRGMFKKTSIESKMETFLNENNIRNDYSFFLAGRQFDFCLTEHHIIIECDGDYWHGRPGTPFEKYEPQIMKQKDDRIKDAICKKYGNIILRFWETDINNNFEWIAKVIMEIIDGKNIDQNIREVEKNYTCGSGEHIRHYCAR